jgi:hypothetical protein
MDSWYSMFHPKPLRTMFFGFDPCIDSARYYVDRGFKIMGSFEDSDETDETPWKGKLLRTDLT